MQDLPTINFSTLHQASTRDALDRACAEWGFFYLTRHSIDRQLVRNMLEMMQQFFALPTEQKLSVERSASNPWGFYNRELTKNRRDWKEIFDVGPDIPTEELTDARAQWPDEAALKLPGFRSCVTAFSGACEAVAQTLIQAISHNLGMPERYLSSCFGADHTSYLRLNYYPTCAQPAPLDAPHFPASGHLGISHHTDSGAITVLLQDMQPGLQVWHDDRWHLIAPRDDALVINIGDVVQVWSNDRYRAPLHRVLAHASAPRFSAPYFYNPGYTTVYEPLPGVCTATHPPRYRPIRWSEFRARRAAGDYADQGEEVQISDYRVRIP
tara:strand:- start:4230 stop:5204 length:975 start_codon:yes stop_codon:yes gene_type:complete